MIKVGIIPAFVKYSETSLIGPPMGPMISGPITEVALLPKTLLMQP